MFVHCTKCTKRKREQTEKPTNPVKIWPYRISNFFYVVSKRRKFRLGKMYNLLGITQSKLRTYGNGNPFNYLGDDHLILRGGGAGKYCWVIMFIFNFLRARIYIFAYFRTDYLFPAITMLYLEVRPDYFFIFLGTQATLFNFKFLAARISYLFPKTASPPPPPPPN